MVRSARLRNMTVWASAPQFLHGAAESFGRIMGDPDADEDDREGAGAFAAKSGVLRDLAGDSVMRQAGARKSGSFCPRTRLFMRSIAEMPVSMKSFGSSRETGLIGMPVDAQLRSAAATGGPPSIGCPTPLKMRPKRPGPSAACRGSPKKRTLMSSSAEPARQFEHFDHHRPRRRARRPGQAAAARRRSGLRRPR